MNGIVVTLIWGAAVVSLWCMVYVLIVDFLGRKDK